MIYQGFIIRVMDSWIIISNQILAIGFPLSTFTNFTHKQNVLANSHHFFDQVLLEGSHSIVASQSVWPSNDMMLTLLMVPGSTGPDIGN